MPVEQGDAMVQADMDALATLANAKSITGRPYAFTSTNWKSELSRLRAAVWGEITDGGKTGYKAPGFVSGPWIFTPPFIIWQSLPLFRNNTSARPLMVRDASQNAQVSTAEYLFGAGGTPAVKLTLWHAKYFAGSGSSQAVAASTTVIGVPLVQGQVMWRLSGNPSGYSLSGDTALVVGSRVDTDADGYFLLADLSADWSGSTVTLVATVTGATAGGPNYNLKFWWRHVVAAEADAVDAVGVLSGGLKSLVVAPIDLTVPGDVEISVMVSEGDATGFFRCVTAPVEALGLDVAASEWQERLWDVGHQEALCAPQTRVNVPLALVSTRREFSPDDFVQIELTVPGAITGTGTFTRENYNNQPSPGHPRDNTVTCDYYKLPLGLTERQKKQLVHFTGGDLTTAPTRVQGYQEIDPEARKFAPLCYQGNLYFLDARLTSGDGKNFWYESAFVPALTSPYHGFRYWFIEQEDDGYYLYLLLDKKRVDGSNDPIGFHIFDGDAAVAGALVSVDGLVRHYFDGATALTVQEIDPALNLYVPGSRFAIFKGAVQFIPVLATVETEFWADEPVTRSQYNQWRMPGVPKGWADDVTAWRSFQPGVVAGPIGFWTTGLKPGPKWTAGQSLKLSVPVRVNQCSAMDYKIMQTRVGWYGGLTSSSGSDGVPRSLTQVGSVLWELQAYRPAVRRELLMPVEAVFRLAHTPARNVKLYYVRTGYDTGTLVPYWAAAYQYDVKAGAKSLGATGQAEQSYFWSFDQLPPVEVDPALYRVDEESGVITPKSSWHDWPNPFDVYGNGLGMADRYSVYLAVYECKVEPGAEETSPYQAIKTELGKQLADGSFVKFTELNLAVNEIRAGAIYPEWPMLEPVPVDDEGQPFYASASDKGSVLRRNVPVVLTEDDYAIEEEATKFVVLKPGDGRDHSIEGTRYWLNSTEDVVMKFRGAWRRAQWKTYAEWKAVDFTKVFLRDETVTVTPVIEGAALAQHYHGDPWASQARRLYFFFLDDDLLLVTVTGGTVTLVDSEGNELDGGTQVSAWVDDYAVARQFFLAGRHLVCPRALDAMGTGSDEEAQKRLVWTGVQAVWQWFDVEVQAFCVQPNPRANARVRGAPFAVHYNDVEEILNAL